MANVLGVSNSNFKTVSSCDIPCRGQILGWTGLIRVDNTTYTVCYFGVHFPF